VVEWTRLLATTSRVSRYVNGRLHCVLAKGLVDANSTANNLAETNWAEGE